MITNFVGDVIDMNYDAIIIISKYRHFKKAWGNIFADIIKIITKFIKKICQDSREFKNNDKFCAKMQSLSVFVDITKFPDFRWKNADVSRNQGVCHVIFVFFWSSLGKV